MCKANYSLVISLVSHGYEIDFIDSKDYAEGKIATKGYECRDYAGNIDVQKLTQKIINLVRNAEKELL